MTQEIKSVADLLRTKRDDGTYGAFTKDREENYFYRLNLKKDDLSAETSCRHITLDPLTAIIFEGNVMENLQTLAISLGVRGNDALDTLKSIMRITTKQDVPATDTATFSIINFIIVTGIEYEYYAETFRYIYQFPQCPDFLKEKSSQTYINSEATKRLAKSYYHGGDDEFFGQVDWRPLGLMNKILEKENSPTAYYDIVFLNQFKVTERNVSCFGVTITMEQLFRYVWSLCLGDNNIVGFRTENAQHERKDEHRFIVLNSMEEYFKQSNLVTKTGKRAVSIREVESVLPDSMRSIYSEGLLVDDDISVGDENALLEDMLTRLLRGYFINSLPPLPDMILRLYDCVHTQYDRTRRKRFYHSTDPSADDRNKLDSIFNRVPEAPSDAPPPFQFDPPSDMPPFSFNDIPPTSDNTSDVSAEDLFRGAQGTSIVTPSIPNYRQGDTSAFFGNAQNTATQDTNPFTAPRVSRALDPFDDFLQNEPEEVKDDLVGSADFVSDEDSGSEDEEEWGS